MISASAWKRPSWGSTLASSMPSLSAAAPTTAGLAGGAAAWPTACSVSDRKLSRRAALCWKCWARVSSSSNCRSLWCRAWPREASACSGLAQRRDSSAGPRPSRGRKGLRFCSECCLQPEEQGLGGPSLLQPRRLLLGAEGGKGCQELAQGGQGVWEIPRLQLHLLLCDPAQQVGHQLLVLGLQRLCLLELKQDLVEGTGWGPHDPLRWAVAWRYSRCGYQVPARVAQWVVAPALS